MQLLVKLVSDLTSDELTATGLTGAPAGYPAETQPYDGTSAVPSGWRVMNDTDVAAAISANAAAYRTWNLNQMIAQNVALFGQPPTIITQVTDMPDATPFAQPIFRTKHDATPAPVTCPNNSTTDIFWQLTEERYMFGGELIVQNAQFGDWITADIYDKDSVLPAPYRPVNVGICEAWPIVSSYVNKQYIRPTTIPALITVDTRPLAARITPGLYLRVTYNAIDAGANAGDRIGVMNYFGAKKL